MAQPAAIAEQVVEADVGRGVHIFLWGLPPDRRLPLRAYHAGLTVKNGVPINYIEGIWLFEWMEVGFNTFYAFRDGETAWIYSKVLHLLHQVAGITCFSVYPYQLGAENEEAIKSGAFWFYRKLGFRPGKPELLAMTEREEAKIAQHAGISDIGAHAAQAGGRACFLRVRRQAAWAVGQVFHAQHWLCRAAPHGGEVQGRSRARCVRPRLRRWPRRWESDLSEMDAAGTGGVRRLRGRVGVSAGGQRLEQS